MEVMETRNIQVVIFTCFFFCSFFYMIQAELEDTKTGLQQKIKKLERKVEEIRASVKACKVSYKLSYTPLEFKSLSR